MKVMIVLDILYSVMGLYITYKIGYEFGKDAGLKQKQRGEK